MKNIKRFNWLIVAMLFAFAPISVMAQSTSSAIGGTIVDSEGNAISDATVVIKHIPTGATKTLSTNEKGHYQARGLRVGGPYSVSVTKSGYGSVNEDDLYIKLGELRDMDATIVADSVSLDSVEVYGVAQSAVFNADAMGSGISIDRDTLENMPTVSRGVTDFLKIDSRINIRDFGDGIAVSGVNSRSNSFSVDGVSVADPFGLEANGFAGLGQPFNIDTIEQLDVQLSPYNVRLSNFTGASINAVTKSGTNEFTGSFNAQYGDEDFTENFNDFTNQIFSLTVGGPIIKDKLFFFLGYENSSRTTVPNDTSVLPASLQEIVDIARDVYSFDAGSFQIPGELDETKENLLVKIDWLINDSHRASFKYRTNEDTRPIVPNFGGGRASLSSHWYDNYYKNDAIALNVFSDWTPNFTTEIRLSRADTDKQPKGLSNLPQIEIGDVGDTGGTVYLGRERFRHANQLAVTEDTFYFEGNYFIGDHTITGGVEIISRDILNTFVFDSFGNYRYNNVDDFRNGFINRYTLRIGSDPSDPYPSADWSWQNNGLFIQDNWMVSQDLTVTYGLRFDKPTTDDRPLFNQAFTDAYGFRNDGVIDSGVLQPRIGFNYDMSDELMMQIRGGIGVFSGGSPNVWLSNPFTNPGGNVSSYAEYGEDAPELNVDGTNPTIPGAGRSFQDVDVLDPDFKLPTVIKTNIAIEAELPWYGLIAGFEYEYTKQQDAIFFEHLNLGAPTGTLPDGRDVYWGNPGELNGGSEAGRNTDFGDVILLTNSGKGNIKRATISLQKRTEHFFTKASYTHTSSAEVSTSTSSRAISNWNNRPSANPNGQELGVSGYQIENAFTFLMNYSNNFFGDTMTNIGLLWLSQDGEPFSYNYRNDVNGDGVRDNDLFYVPNVGEYVIAGTPEEAAEFERFLDASGLSAYRGQIAPRNAFKAPRVNQWDLKIKQELPDFGFARASLFFSIKNLGNLLNDDWGTVYTGSFDGVNIVDLDGFDDQGRYILDPRIRSGGEVNANLSRRFIPSQWQAQVGFRLDW